MSVGYQESQYDTEPHSDDEFQLKIENEHKYSSTSCRACLKEGVIPIFGIQNLSHYIKEFTKIEVNKNDGFPQYLCKSCNSLLEAAVRFLKTAKRVDNILKNILIDYDNSIIEEDDIKEDYIEYEDSLHSESYDTNEQLDEDEKKSLVPKLDDHDNTELYEAMAEDNGNENIEMNLLKLNEDCNSCGADNEMIMIVVSEKNEVNRTCDKCNITFDTNSDLYTHNTECHLIYNNQKECVVCHEQIENNMYKEHLQKHRNKYKEKKDKLNGKVECEICHKRIGKSYYNYHKKMHGTETEQAERLVECPICNKSFNSYYITEHRRRVHDGIIRRKEFQNEKQIKCPICDELFKESIFKEHLSKHSVSKKDYICDQCGKVCKSASSLKTHTLIHGGVLKYKCQFCPYVGLHQGLLKIHVRTHTGDYNYKCTECPAKFTTKSNLSKHYNRCHLGTHNYQCDRCSKLFFDKRTLERHNKAKHSDMKDVICDLCGKAFGHRDNMLSHQLKVHKRQKFTEGKGRVPTYLKVTMNADVRAYEDS